MFTLTIEGRVARLALDRPAKRNAIGLEHWRALPALLAPLGSGAARLLVVESAAEGVFSGGADIAEFDVLRHEPQARADFHEAMRSAISALADCTLPTLALVEGGCFGAAVALTLACDVRIAGEGARFAITPAKLGIAYPAEDLVRLIAAVGSGQAARLLFSARPIDAAEALRIGLVDTAGGRAAADAFAEAVGANARSSLVALKRLLRAAAAGAVGEDTDRLFRDAFGSADFGRGLDAFRERRAPEFD